MAKHRDELQIQVAVKIKARPNAKIHPRVLQQILDAAVNGEELPPAVEFNGIFWRNPDRRGKLSYWRYHVGANLDKVAPADRSGQRFIDGVPVEETPRGSLQEAIDTLAGAIFSGIIKFR